MSLMKSIDGRLYNVPDEQAAKYLIPADKVAEVLKEAGLPAPAGAGTASQEAGQIKAYSHHGGHGGHHGGHHGGWGGWGGFVVAPYSNYSNYGNYRNFGW